MSASAVSPGEHCRGAAGRTGDRPGRCLSGATEQVTYELGDPGTKALLLHSALDGADAFTARLDSLPSASIEVIAPVDLPPRGQQ